MLPLLLPFLGPLVDKLVGMIPDPAAQERAKAEAMTQIIAAAQAADAAQNAVNQQEAGSSSVFVAGWRPFIGWICGAALGFQYIVRPFLIWGCDLAHIPVMNIPGLDDNLWQLMLGMLGMGGLRTFEKIKGVDTSSVQTAPSRPLPQQPGGR